MATNPEEIMLEGYEAKVFKNRSKHMLTIDSPIETPQEITANSRTIPGLLGQRGCCFAGCKGVVLGPIKDAVTLVHGPIGCAYYSWGTRRHKAIPNEEDGLNYIPYCFSTDMQEENIVFGGETKLKKAIDEVMEIFNPPAILICSTCPVGLIGDDIHAIAAAKSEEYGIKVIAFSCEGYKGVSQSAGHHIASNQIIRHIIGTGEDAPKKKYSINILGEYNIGGDAWEAEKLLEKIGYEVVSTFTGDGSISHIKNAHLADLNVIQCHRSINYVGDMMKTQYGIDWIKVNFVGVETCKKSLRDIATYFGDPELIQRTEEVIAEEMEVIQEELEYYRSKLDGKKAALYVGGSRSHHYQKLLRDFGIKTVMAGYEFAHRDDYEGREVIPDIKIDADGKNIESLDLEPVEGKYHLRFSPEDYEELAKKIDLNYYGGMHKDMERGAIVIDDLNHYETEQVIRFYQPDVFFSGIKDKFVCQKSGTLSRQLHSYDYQGPYAGFRGAVNFGHDLVMGLNTPTWSLTTPPWKKGDEEFPSEIEGVKVPFPVGEEN